MFPKKAAPDSRNHVCADTICACDGNMSTTCSSYFTHLLFGQFCIAVILSMFNPLRVLSQPVLIAARATLRASARTVAITERAKSHHGCMSTILKWGNIFEVIRTIIHLVTILVIYLMVIRAGTNKSRSNQKVNGKDSSCIIDAKSGNEIARGILARLQKPSRCCAESGPVAANAAQIRDGVILLISRYGLPDFVCEFFSGVIRHTQFYLKPTWLNIP